MQPAGGSSPLTTRHYHRRKRSLCRAFKSLSCVFYRAHDKEALCRALNKTHGNESLPCVLFLTHGKDSLACVLISGARQRFFSFPHFCNKRPLVFAVRFNFRRTAKIFSFLHFFNKQ
jgi:hypothetical protein